MTEIELTICTYNVRTLRTDNKHVELEMELERMSWDVVGLCETRMLGRMIIEKPNGNVLCYEGIVQGKYGVGILVHPRLKNCIDEFVFISDRVIGLKLKIQGKSLSCVQVYAPTMSSDDTNLDKFYDELNRARVQCQTDYQIFMGDFNAMVRAPHTYNTRNNRGLRLNGWIQQHQLVIANTLFLKQPENDWTYHSPGYLRKDERDFIIGKPAEMFEDVSICRNFQFDSDHRMVMAKVVITGCCMADFFPLWHNMESLESQNDKKFRMNYSPSLKALKAERDELIKMEKNTTKDQKARLDRLREYFNESIMKDINDYKDKTFDGYQWIKQLKHDHRTVTKRMEINEIATKYFQLFFTPKISGRNRNICLPMILDRKDQLSSISASEIHSISGKHDISYHESFNQILRDEQFPRSWKSWIIRLHCPHEDEERIEYYKPIVKLTLKHRTFAQCLVNRLRAALENTLSPEQFGFNSNRSKLHILHCINQIIEKSNEYRLQVYFAVVDFTERVNEVEHGAIWESLKNLRVGNKLLRLLMKMYRNNFGRIDTGEIGRGFKLGRGLLSGDPLASILLCSVSENIFYQLAWDNYGISINGSNLNSLRFKNKCLLIAKSRQEMQKMLCELNDKCRATGLNLNVDNTKIMTNSKDNVPIKKYQYINDCIFLDQFISFENREAKEVARRIRKTLDKYSQMETILQAEEDITTRFSLFKRKILPILVYGVETWSLLQKTIGRLVTIQNKLEKKNFDPKDQMNIVSYVKHLKSHWADRVARLDSSDWTKLITEWIPNDSPRKRGKAPKRWRDDL